MKTGQKKNKLSETLFQIFISYQIFSLSNKDSVIDQMICSKTKWIYFGRNKYNLGSIVSVQILKKIAMPIYLILFPYDSAIKFINFGPKLIFAFPKPIQLSN